MNSRWLLCMAVVASFKLSTAASSQADPLIVMIEDETALVHCSIASRYSGVELWQMIGEPFIVEFDDEALGCISAEEKLAQKKPTHPKPPILAGLPGVGPIPWCYCRRETADLLRQRMRTIDGDFYKSLVVAEHNAFVEVSLKPENLPAGITRERAVRLYEQLGLVRVDPRSLESATFQDIEQRLLQRLQNGFNFPSADLPVR